MKLTKAERLLAEADRATKKRARDRRYRARKRVAAEAAEIRAQHAAGLCQECG